RLSSRPIYGHGCGDEGSRLGDHVGYVGTAFGGRSGSAGLAGLAVNSRLALAARPRRQPLVSHDAFISSKGCRRLDQCFFRNVRRAGETESLKSEIVVLSVVHA